MISDSGMQLTESDGGSASDVLSDSNDAEFTSGSGMFSGSQNLVVMATTLTNITNNSSATALRGPSGIRMFAFEDIDLLREIPLENGVAIFNQRGCVRRLHSSNVSGRQGAVAAAVYQGNDAYKEWKQDIARYRSVGHPNIVQIFGAATSGTIYATLFNDDLIPVAHFMDLYRHSPILTVYIYGYCSTQLEDADRYFYETFNCGLFQDSESQNTVWIRRSNGNLCVDIAPVFNHRRASAAARLCPDSAGRNSEKMPGMPFLNAINVETMVIDSLSLSQYHTLCAWALFRSRSISVSARLEIKLGIIIFCPPGNHVEEMVEIASMGDVRSYGLATGVHLCMQVDWTRYQSSEVLDATVILESFSSYQLPHQWLSQANHTFDRLDITSNLEEITIVDGVEFSLSVSAPTSDPPNGFLFLCPAKQFQAGPFAFTWPECAAYWSLDSSGVERLSTEDANSLGFPSIEFSTRILGKSWPANVYSGLRQFHRAKGFNPNGQDVSA